MNENQSFDLEIAWNNEWLSNNPINHDLIVTPSQKLPGFNWPRDLWSKINRFRSEQGRCNFLMCKWGIVDNPFCDCGQIEQKMSHIVNDCPRRAFPGGIINLHQADNAAKKWLKNLDIPI